MKIKQEFVLREIAGETVLIPVMSKEDVFHGVISLNETGAFIWKQLQQEKELNEIISALMEEYEVTGEQAQKNVEDFCRSLERMGIL